MKITCLVLGTAKRTEWLNLTIKSIDKLNFVFDKKILSIDQFDGFEIAKEVIDEFQKNSWSIDIVNFKNKHLSIKNAIKNIDSDYIFYCEDDILINDIPEDVFKILDFKDKMDRECGILSMNLGGSKLDYPHNMGDMPYWVDNLIFENENMTSFLRLESEANRWFFEFPSVFIKKNILNNILEGDVISNNVIEEELTNRFFIQNLQNKYFKASFCKKNIYHVLDLLLNNKDVSFWIEKLESTKFYKILDPNQGGAKINLNEIK